ncbi:MAG: hypothetical protein KBG75_03230 [Pseudomonadales bacterium]|nr:hypothetical protein [Pseudomonadales bacterium]
MTRLILMLLCLQLGYAYAEEPAVAAPATPAKTADETAAATPGTAAASKRFEPSEKISEDLSVSFPADI